MRVKDIIDPTDIHKRVNLKKSVFECDLRGKNVLSISTVEHIGLSDYGMCETLNCVDAINKILAESKMCLITAPLGYNEMLDNWVRVNAENPMVTLMKREINNHWIEIEKYEEIKYSSLWACGLVIIKKVEA